MTAAGYQYMFQCSNDFLRPPGDAQAKRGAAGGMGRQLTSVETNLNEIPIADNQAKQQ